MCVHQTSELQSKWSKDKELKGEIDKFTIIVGDLSILLSTTDRKMRQKIIKVIEELNNPAR